MKLFLGIAHAAFDPSRAVVLKQLLDALPTGDPDVVIYVEEDHDRSGAWIPSRAAMEAGLATDAEYILIANDDMLPCVDFFMHVRRVIRAVENKSPFNGPIAFYANHEAAKEVAATGGGLYTTHDGLVGVCFALHRDAAREFLEWHDRTMTAPMLSSDTPVCYWAMANQWLIHHTSPSLVDHQCPDTSLRGHEKNGFRRPAVLPWEDTTKLLAIDWGKPVVHAGLRYSGTHWKMLADVKQGLIDKDLIEAAYVAARSGAKISTKPHVLICTPAYALPELGFIASRELVQRDLAKNGIRSSTCMTNGDSLVTRGRHVLMHEFLMSTATHLLFWDSDIEVLDPSCVTKMLGTGRSVLGGACPFRNDSGRVVCNALESDVARGGVAIQGDGCIEVARIGTGFLLISREAILRMCSAYSNTFYIADTASHAGHPMWALFDTRLLNRRYFSEDYVFCERWRAMGDGSGGLEKVWVYMPASFLHYGKSAFQGSLREAWGLGSESNDTANSSSEKEAAQ